MPERYAISTVPERLNEDYGLYKEVIERGFGLRVREEGGGMCEIIVGARDRPGVFSRIVGILSSMKMDIYRARAYTSEDGIIVDKIHVSNWRELEWKGIVQAIEERLYKAIGPVQEAGYEKIIGGIRDSQGYIPAATEMFGRFEPFVELDNETSAECSVIEFFAQDRLGILYEAANLMHEKGIDIISARINTESGLAHDVFYVQREGMKLASEVVSDLVLSLWEKLR
jgi:[protein-PII] uridylyltransferase